MAEILNFDDKKQDLKQKILEETDNIKQQVEEDKIDYTLLIFKHSLLNLMDGEYE